MDSGGDGRGGDGGSCALFDEPALAPFAYPFALAVACTRLICPNDLARRRNALGPLVLRCGCCCCSPDASAPANGPPDSTRLTVGLALCAVCGRGFVLLPLPNETCRLRGWPRPTSRLVRSTVGLLAPGALRRESTAGTSRSSPAAASADEARLALPSRLREMERRGEPTGDGPALAPGPVRVVAKLGWPYTSDGGKWGDRGEEAGEVDGRRVDLDRSGAATTGCDMAVLGERRA